MLKKYIRICLQKAGYEISKIRPKTIADNNPFEDMHRLLHNKLTPVIFDVGANVGQSIGRFRDYFPKSEVYSFEPGPDTFVKLSGKYRSRKNIHLENVGVGSENTKMEFLENDHSDMSSFLQIDRLAWGKINRKILIDIVSVDTYCQMKGIKKIDILKSDTQGFELEVFKGAMQMMKFNNIQLVYFEFIFSDQYKELPSFDEVFKLLTDNNFRLVKLYDFRYQEGLLSWADLLFVNLDYDDR